MDKSKPNKFNKQGLLKKALESRLMQEVIVIELKNKDGAYSHSEISYLCVN